MSNFMVSHNVKPESSIISFLEQVKLRTKSVCYQMKIIYFSPAFEFLEPSQFLNGKWRISEITVVDSSVMPHNETAKLKSYF